MKTSKSMNIIVLTICAVVCGCETWEDIGIYGKEKQQWLSRFLSLPSEITAIPESL